MEYFYILDLTGTFAFAVYGAYIGLKKNFDYVGIFLCAFLVAVGGGTVREIILNRTPFYFHDYNYIYTIFIGVIFCAITYNYFHKINKVMLVLDAVGLSTFAYIGATKAIEANLGFFGAVFFAVLTAIGGGHYARYCGQQDAQHFFDQRFLRWPSAYFGSFAISF